MTAVDTGMAALRTSMTLLRSFSGRCSHSKQITAAAAASGWPCSMQPQANA